MVFIDDRWLYDLEDDLPSVAEQNLAELGPQIICKGNDITIAACGYSTRLALEAAGQLRFKGIDSEVIDLRILNPFCPDLIAQSVERTGRLLVVDGGWATCGMAGEVIASVMERVQVGALKKPPVRVTLPSAPAPTARIMEKAYYPSRDVVVARANELLR